jgi:hypothetical protein
MRRESIVGEAVDERSIRTELSTGPVRSRPALSISRFSADSFSTIDRRSISGACKINQQIHNSYYYCYSFLDIQDPE